MARLAGFALALSLVVSRAGLLVHEAIGHGAAAYAVGSSVTGLRLYAVAGGWIEYGPARWSDARVAVVTLGGIAVEWLVAAALALAARRRAGWLGFALTAAAWGLALHGALYLAVGSADGVGDGQWLYRALGPARIAVALPVALAVWLGGFVAARRLGATLMATLPSARRGPRAAALALALVAAGAVHGGAVAAEVVLRDDATYARVMASERTRAMARELAAWRAEAEAAGRHDLAAERAARRAIAARHREGRYGPAIAIGLAVAVALGFALASAGGATRLPASVVTRVAVAATLAVVLVVAVDRAAAAIW